MTPKVSIIIPVYNVEPYVGECIESVMAQDAQIPMECIVVDDRGPDNSMVVVNKLVEAYHGPIEFRIITREKNGGLSAARNSGIDVARGEYLYFLDSDDTITSDAIRLLWHQVEVYPGVDMVVGAVKCFPTPDMDDIIDINRVKHPSFTCNVSEINEFFIKIPEIAWNKLFRVRFLLDNRLKFKEGIIHEDLHQHIRISCHIKSIAFLDKVTYNYRMRQGSIMKTSNEILRNKRVFLIFDDVVEQGYHEAHLLKFILYWISAFRLKVDTDHEWMEIRETYYSCLKNIANKLPIIPGIPFKYLSFPRPLMRFAILYKLAKYCLK